MPQSTLELISGYFQLSADTLSQRFVNRHVPSHPLFQGDANYLSNQTAIVTGANTGIGLETTRMLAAAGATVILACRNASKAEAAVVNIRSTHPTARLEVYPLDLGCKTSVRAFASKMEGRACHMLILNGGVMGVPQTKPETHFTVNHIGHVLLTILLIPNVQSVHGRIVVVSSLTFLVSDLVLSDLSFERRTYRWMTAYANSKLCMLLFMCALQTRVSNVCVNAVHPGEATSDVARNLGATWMALHKRVGGLFLLSACEAARTSVYVAGARELTGNGKLYHRVSETIDMPERLVGKADVEDAWAVSLEAAGLNEDDLSGIWGANVSD